MLNGMPSEKHSCLQLSYYNLFPDTFAAKICRQVYIRNAKQMFYTWELIEYVYLNSFTSILVH